MGKRRPGFGWACGLLAAAAALAALLAALAQPGGEGGKGCGVAAPGRDARTESR